MFGFSRRRMKLARRKAHLGDPVQGARSPLRQPTKRNGQQNEEVMANSLAEDINNQPAAAALNIGKCSLDSNNENWMVVSTSGDKPVSRSHHAAAVVGSKMVIVGGESGQGLLLDDTQVLSLDKLSWACASPKVYLSPTGLPLKIPSCKGHSLVSWGKKVLLIGGKTEPMCDKVSVWSFDVDTECWSHIDAKGDVPVARGGHTVTRAGPALILFGGEDAKGRKLNDLHMFDLKSSMWLPLHYTGTGPSPRCDHVATLFDDKILYVFGGKSKSRILNDLYALDFETMVWSRIKVQGHHPSPRAGSRGVLCGTKWYIVGGGSKKKRCMETLVFDVLKLEILVAVASSPTSITTNKGFSLVPVHHKEKVFLVAFGGNKKELSNEIEILILEKNESSTSWQSAVDKDHLLLENFPAGPMELASHLKNSAPPCSINSVVRHSLASAMEHHHSGRRSLSESTIGPNSGNTSLRKQFHQEEDYSSIIKLQKALEDEKFEAEDCLQVPEHRKLPEIVVKMDTAGTVTNTEDAPSTNDVGNPNKDRRHGGGNLPLDGESNMTLAIDGNSILSSMPSNIYQFYENKMTTLSRKNVLLEGQLAAAMANRENTERNLSSAIKIRQEMEKRLADTVKEMDMLKEKLASLELAQEEANSLSNLVHSDNVRLEHDVAFLKAVLDDTQKELHSTRGVLAGERARAFQLQVEVFHLKQRLQSMENRAPTPRKPFQL